MAEVKIEDVVDYLDAEFKKALDDTMLTFAPGVKYDRNKLFNFFVKRIFKHCALWEAVPDSVVRA